MDSDKNKLSLAVSLVTEKDEVTKPEGYKWIIHDNEQGMFISFALNDETKDKINNNEIGFAITNGYFEKLMEEQNAVESDDFIYLKIGIVTMKVFFKNILYIIASNNYAIIYTTKNEQLVSTNNLEWFNQKCPSDYFMQIHGSHIINMKMITRYIDNGRTGVVIMTNDKDLDVSQRMKHDFDIKAKQFIISVFK